MSTWERYIKHFVSFLKIEKGLAENSIFAYQNDVAKLADFSIGQNLEVTDLTFDQKNFPVISITFTVIITITLEIRNFFGQRRCVGLSNVVCISFD